MAHASVPQANDRPITTTTQIRCILFHSSQFPSPSRGDAPRHSRWLLTNNLSPKCRILIRHSPPQRPLDLRTQSQFAEVIALFGCGLVSLLLEALVFKAVEAGGPFFDFLEAGIGAAVIFGRSGGSGTSDGGSGGESVGVGGEDGGVG